MPPKTAASYNLGKSGGTKASANRIVNFDKNNSQSIQTCNNQQRQISIVDIYNSFTLNNGSGQFGTVGQITQTPNSKIYSLQQGSYISLNYSTNVTTNDTYITIPPGIIFNIYLFSNENTLVIENPIVVLLGGTLNIYPYQSNNPTTITSQSQYNNLYNSALPGGVTFSLPSQSPCYYLPQS